MLDGGQVTSQHHIFTFRASIKRSSQITDWRWVEGGVSAVSREITIINQLIGLPSSPHLQGRGGWGRARCGVTAHMFQSRVHWTLETKTVLFYSETAGFPVWLLRAFWPATVRLYFIREHLRTPLSRGEIENISLLYILWSCWNKEHLSSGKIQSEESNNRQRWENLLLMTWEDKSQMIITTTTHPVYF